MIVSIKLSISDRALEDVLYHCKRLKELADAGTAITPGYIYLDFNGYKGKTLSSSHSKYKHRRLGKVQPIGTVSPPTPACNLFDE